MHNSPSAFCMSRLLFLLKRFLLVVKKGLCRRPCFSQVVLSESKHPISDYVTEFFVPLDRASEALEAVSQESSKWPGWLHSETAKGTKYESCPLVFHCEVRVGKFCNTYFECAYVLQNLNIMQLQGIPLLGA